MTSPDHILASNRVTDATTATTLRRQPRAMQSLRALLGSIAVLAALPLTILTSVVFGGGDGIVVHAALGTGMVLLAASVFDFRTPAIISWVGMAAMLLMGAIFLAQGVGEAVQSPALFAVVYGDPTIQAVEKLASYPIIIWCVGLLLVHSRGKSRILGAVSLIAIAAVEIYALWITSTGGELDIRFRFTYLLAFVWLAVEGGKSRPWMPGSLPT